MRQACVPKVEIKGLWLATTGLGMIFGLITFGYISLTFGFFLTATRTSDFLVLMLIPALACGLGAMWGALLTLTLERVWPSILMLGLISLVTTSATAYAIVLSADDGLSWIWGFRGSAAYFSVLLTGFYVGVVTLLIWGTGTFFSLLPRWILGRPRAWTPAMCPRCLYDIGDERIEVCPECGAIRDVSFASRNWSARWVNAGRRGRWWLIGMSAVIFGVWTSQQVITHTIPQWRFHRAVGGEPVTPWAFYFIDLHDAKTAALIQSGDFAHVAGLRRSRGRYVLDVTTLSTKAANKLHLSNSQVVRERVPVRVIATLSPVQTRRVMRNGALPSGMLAAMEDRWLEVDGGSSVVFDASPFFDPD